MAEIILPPEEETPETPQTPELNIDKPTENSKVITIEFEAKKTNKVSTKDTNQQLYTTDTDAWFEFKETSLENANGTYSVVFRNRHDGSIFQRTGDVVNGVAYYKIPHQEIRHAGKWRGQLVYTLENGNTTAREFGYDVKGHILDGKDVREIVVEDFETLMSQLNSMKDNAELELADLVNTANQNETDRQVFFDDLVEDIDELQANYQELLDTGVLQTNINTKLEALEEEYAPKLTEVTAQLAHKANKSEVRKDTDIQPISVHEMDTETKQLFTGGSVAVVGEDAVGTENIKDKAVQPAKTTFFDISENLLDADKVQNGKAVSETGTVVSDSNWWMSEKIPVQHSSQMSITSSKYRLAYFGEDDSFIIRAGATDVEQFNVPASTAVKYLVVCGDIEGVKPQNVMLNVGRPLKPFRPYGENIIKEKLLPNYKKDLEKDEVDSQHIKDNAILNNHIKNGIIRPEKTSFFKTSENLLNPKTVKENTFIDDENVETTDNEWWTSDYIAVSRSEKLYISHGRFRINYYDGSNNLLVQGGITGVDAFTVTSSTAVRSIRVIGHYEQIRPEETMLNRGPKKLDFMEYGKKIIEEKYLPKLTNADDSFIPNNEKTLKNVVADEEIDVTEYSYLEADFNFGRGSYSIKASKDGIKYETLSLIKKDTGTRYERISIKAVYQADIRGYQKIKWTKDFVAQLPLEVDFYLTTKDIDLTKEELANKMYAPAQPKLDYEKKAMGSKAVVDMDENGNLYALDKVTSGIFKSEDMGDTWDDLKNPATNNMDTIRVLKDNSLIAITRNRVAETMEYWKTDVNQTNWKKVYEHEIQGILMKYYGFDIVDNVIVFAPYQNIHAEKLIQVHLSTDYGETWKPIFNSPLIEQWHIHDVAYDPYSDRIWMVTGDGTENANTYWTDNEGEKWFKADDDNVGRSQFTGIQPLPNMMLFATDESRVRGVIRSLKDSKGANKLPLDPAFHDMLPGGTDKNIVVSTYAKYWETGNVAYFIANKPGNIYATKDGYNYYTVYTGEKDAGSIGYLTRLNNKGKMVANLQVSYTENYLLIIDELKWNEI